MIWQRWAGRIVTPLLLLRLMGAAETPQVVSVYPSGPTIAENLLRISIRFASAAEGERSLGIGLEQRNGAAIAEVFDRNATWSPDGKVLTLLLGPGRVKTGLLAHDELGRALAEGESVSLSLAGRMIKTWRVVDSDNEPLNAQRWKVETPRAQTRGAFRIRFTKAIDAMDCNYLAIVGPGGERVSGRTELSDCETVWSFVPDRKWRRGDYVVMVHPHLEDPCGNTMGGSFEQKNATELFSSPVRLIFRIG